MKWRDWHVIKKSSGKKKGSMKEIYFWKVYKMDG